MADPQTADLGFYQPTPGSDVGTWGLPINANAGALDSLFSNVATISLTNAPVTLNLPPNSGAAWAGPYQSQSALINLIGTITANIIITIPRPGFFIFWNQCLSTGNPAGGNNSNNYIQLRASGVGNVVGCPVGKKFTVFCDGTNVDFVDLPDPGTQMTLTVSELPIDSYPTWMTACTVSPWLLMDGSVYLNTAYPTLAALLGTIFGGVSGTSFQVPTKTPFNLAQPQFIKT
jgi:hypothetical protein